MTAVMEHRAPTSLDVTDLFCGAGGSAIGAKQAGFEVYMAANHSELAIATHELNFPDTRHDCADISQVDPRRYRRTLVLWASPECFTAGHLVTTTRGQMPIEDVQVGDIVLTHLGRWRPVVRVQERQAPTVAVRGQGHTGIETTASHRFWLRTSDRKWNNEVRQYQRQYADADWLEIGHAVAREALWATPTSVDPLPTKVPPSIFGPDETAAWWLVGRWVGDGSLSFGRNHEVSITCGFHESTELGERLAATGTAWAQSTKRTADVFSVGDVAARDWLLAHFGHGAANKQLPTWVLSLPRAQRRALLDGYLSADGGVTQRRVRCSTVSRALAVSVRLLAESLGHRVSMAHDKRTTYSIEGREGVARLQWILHWEPQLAQGRAPQAFDDGRHAWSRVREVAPAQVSTTVYNIEVEEDHSYVLDGIVVSNCTNHSQAKGQRRAAKADERNLFDDDDERPANKALEARSRATMWDVVRFCDHHRYRFVVVENVTDVVEWDLFDAWTGAMAAMGYRHRVVSLNSMHAPAQGGRRAPQSRDRVYIVFWAKSEKEPDVVPRPVAWCDGCATEVRAVQVFKNGRSVGKYRTQYVYRCPNVACRNQIVEPYASPAAEAIDWTNLGTRIGDKKPQDRYDGQPLAPKTLARIKAGLVRYAARPVTFEAAGNTFCRTRPDGSLAYTRSWPVDEPTRALTTSETRALVCPSGGTWNDTALSVMDPLRTRTTRETDALVVPMEGRAGTRTATTTVPLRSMTTRHQDALVVPYYGNSKQAKAAAHPMPTMGTVDTAALAFIAELRGGGSDHRPITDPLATVTASGNHHALVRAQQTLIQRHNAGGAEMLTPATEPFRTLTTGGHQSVVESPTPLDFDVPDVEDCFFRMLTPDEIGLAMAFGTAAEYRVLGNKRDVVKQYGNGVTPPAAEFLLRAIREAVAS